VYKRQVKDIEELAGDILLSGLKQNLELVYAPCEKGEYRIVAGERRWEALKYLVSKGYNDFELATSKLTTPQDDDEEQVEIIIANAYRTKTISDMIEEETRLKASLERMKAAGKKIKGYDLQSGRLRDVISSMLHMSKTKIAQIEAVNNNLIPEWREELKKERLTFSAAYELSGMTEDEQREALGKFAETGELTHKEVKDMKEAKAAGQQVSESDTAESSMNPPEVRAGDDYETPHPEGITSICYSCTEYETCNVKTGTCTSCDQYNNRAEAYKTDEQRYSEEQDAIDRETKKKLREMEQEEKMQSLPSDTQETGQKVHQIRLAKPYFDDVANGIKTFELQKNDRGYKKGDILEMMEFADGKNTGRMVKVLVTYILEDYTGIEDGYCIMATKLMKDGEA
jgi:ParB family chromosome partitioning protein